MSDEMRIPRWRVDNAVCEENTGEKISGSFIVALAADVEKLEADLARVTAALDAEIANGVNLAAARCGLQGEVMELREALEFVKERTRLRGSDDNARHSQIRDVAEMARRALAQEAGDE